MVTVEFNPCGGIKTLPLYQFDYGQQMEFVGFDDLPATFEVHFANEFDGDAITQLAENNVVDIPDMMLTSGYNIYAWIFLHESEEEGATKYFIEIPVMERAEPSDDPPTPVEQSIITQAIAALQGAVTEAEAAAEAAEAARDEAVSLIEGGTPGQVFTMGDEGAEWADLEFIGIQGNFNRSMWTVTVEDTGMTVQDIVVAFFRNIPVYLWDINRRFQLAQVIRQQSGLMWNYRLEFEGADGAGNFYRIVFSQIGRLATSMNGTIYRFGKDTISLEASFDGYGNVTLDVDLLGGS